MAFTRSDANMMRTAWELSAGMLSFVVALGLGYWFGRTIDAWFDTAPWLTRIFVAFGFVAGVLNVYRTLARAMTPGGSPDPAGAHSTTPGTPGTPGTSRTASESETSGSPARREGRD